MRFIFLIIFYSKLLLYNDLDCYNAESLLSKKGDLDRAEGFFPFLRDLLTGTKRFGELKKSVSGISQKVLTAHLRSMEEDSLVNRKIYAQIPPRVEYSLTETGWSLKPVLDAMAQWGETYRCKIQNLV